ncbi:MAG: head-tail connector protein [Syntrophorhabdaceae bacterium]
MKVQLKTAPTLEPIALADLKMHLKLDSETMAGDLTTYQSILPGSHGISAGGAYTHVGTGVDVLGKQSLVNLNAGTVGAGGTVDAKFQESDDNLTWTDWTGGAFTQVTAANDNAIQEKAYTGTKQYIRVVAKVLVAACEFGADIIVNAETTYEDDLLTAIITAAREHVEDITRRALLTQTWYYYLDRFPDKDYIVIPFGNLQSITSIKYKDSDGTETTMTVTTDYIVETNGEGCGRIVLPYGVSWPSVVPYPSNPITIEFVCGWTAAASIPKKIIAAIKMICSDLYENRESQMLGNPNSLAYQENKTVSALLASARLWEEFE